MSPPCLSINNIKANLMFQCRERITLLRSTWHYLSPSHSVWGLMALIVLQIQFQKGILPLHELSLTMPFPLLTQNITQQGLVPRR